MTVLAHCSHGDELEQLLRNIPCDLAVLDYYLAHQPIGGVNLIRRTRGEQELTVGEIEAGL